MTGSRARRLGGRLALAAVVTSVLLPLVTPVPASAHPRAEAPRTALGADKAKPRSSWQADRTEEFSGSSLPDGCGAYRGRYTAGKSAWSAKYVVVDDGLLQLTLDKRKTGRQPYTSGGVGCWGWAQKYGKFEVRAKVPAGAGLDSYLTLWPVKGGEEAWSGIELLAPGPDHAYITNGYGSRSEGARVAGDYAGAFHDYTIEWAPKHMRMLVDGREVFYSTRSYKGSRYLGLVMSNGDALTGVPDRSTELPARFEIDRVKISSYTGVAPKARAIAPSRTRPTLTPTPVPSPSVAAKAPPVTPSPSASTLAAEPTAQTGPALAGGVWPWLLGGSLIAVFAVASLNYPHHRRTRPEARPRS